MGNVAAIAAGHLIRTLGFVPVAEVPPRGHFDVEDVEVRSGVVVPSRVPRSIFFRSPLARPEPGQDFTVFLGEAQPATGGYAFAHELLDKAREYGVKRVVTFASMATGLHPSQEPRVFGAATTEGLVKALGGVEVKTLDDGQIGGLNGVLLGAVAERCQSQAAEACGGVCLLGEIPYFAAGVPNPKAARAVLQAFGRLTGIGLDLKDLIRDGKAIDRALIRLLQRLQEQSGPQGGESGPPDEEGEEEPDYAAIAAGEEDPDDDDSPTQEPPAPGPEQALDYAARRKIEGLFQEAAKDKSKAVALKQELDRLGAFAKYENRFLDLFKRAE
jgi:proteasome assembly chaperone (PAC2) family protein